jgi:hypothetical protein
MHGKWITSLQMGFQCRCSIHEGVRVRLPGIEMSTWAPRNPRYPFWEVDLTYLNLLGFSPTATEATSDEYKGGDFPPAGYSHCESPVSEVCLFIQALLLK